MLHFDEYEPNCDLDSTGLETIDNITQLVQPTYQCMLEVSLDAAFESNETAG